MGYDYITKLVEHDHMHRRKPSRERFGRTSFGRRLPYFNFIEIKEELRELNKVAVLSFERFKFPHSPIRPTADMPVFEENESRPEL